MLFFEYVVISAVEVDSIVKAVKISENVVVFWYFLYFAIASVV